MVLPTTDVFALIILLTITLFTLYWAAKTYAALYRENQALREEIVHIIAERHAIDDPMAEYVKVIPANTNK